MTTSVYANYAPNSDYDLSPHRHDGTNVGLEWETKPDSSIPTPWSVIEGRAIGEYLRFCRGGVKKG